MAAASGGDPGAKHPALEALERKMAEQQARIEAKMERSEALKEALADSALSEEQRARLAEEHTELERLISRQSRKRFSREDFESLVMVGKGHFGEVSQEQGHQLVRLSNPCLRYTSFGPASLLERAWRGTFTR
jgi:hypothetical protein